MNWKQYIRRTFCPVHLAVLRGKKHFQRLCFLQIQKILQNTCKTVQNSAAFVGICHEVAVRGLSEIVRDL